MRYFLVLIGVLLLSGLSTTVQAKAPPVPESKKERIESIHRDLDKHKNQSQRLEEEARTIHSTLKTTKEALVDLGQSIQENERQLRSLEKRITEKEVEKLQITQNLDKDRQSISRLILALQRIERVPPEALILKPDAPLKTAQSAMLMGDVLPTLYRSAQELKEKVQTLEKISTELKAEKNQAVKISKSLKEEHEDLSVLIKKRESLYARTNADLQEERAYVDKISTQVKSLNELVARLEESRKQEEAAKQARIKEEVTPAKILASVKRAIPGSNASQIPVSGNIILAYNEKDTFGAPSQGLEIEARSEALVVAPMKGTVRFAGPFKNYGNMVIVDHNNGYHSLIAGLGKIDTVVGHELSAGEPIGNLKETSPEKKPILYYELRLNGKPVNPAKKLKGLS